MRRVTAILTLLFITTVANAQSKTAAASSSRVSVNNISERALVLSEKEINVTTELVSNITDYKSIYIVEAMMFMPDWDRFAYSRTPVKNLTGMLKSSRFEIVNPYEYSNRKFNKDKYFLRDIKDDNAIYLYLNQSRGKGDDLNTSLILRNSEGETLFKANFINAGMNEVLDVITGI